MVRIELGEEEDLLHRINTKTNMDDNLNENN